VNTFYKNMRVVFLLLSCNYFNVMQAGQYQLHDLVINQDYSTVEIIERLSHLITSGSENYINLVNKGCKTALNLAVEHKADPEIVEFLLENGADANIPDLFNTTPLHNAIIYDQIESAKILLDHGADPYFKNDGEQSSIDLTRSDETKDLFSNYY